MSAYLQPLTPPVDEEKSGTLNGLVQQMAAYLKVIGLDGITSIVVSVATPSAEDRDKVWLKKTSGGALIGLFHWSGIEWVQVPFSIASGSTIERPAVPSPFSFYHDTDIDCTLIFERNKWRTLSGTKGDVKFVRATTLAEAIKRNPGWVQCADATGRVLGAAGSTQGLTNRAYGDKVGSETVQLKTEELPSHKHGISGLSTDFMSRDDLRITAWAGPGSPAIGYNSVSKDTDTEGGDQGHENMQPTLFLWCLEKE
jgi:hypothetical protein